MKNNDPVILVTGATAGIGKQTAQELAALGRHVVVHGRSRSSADEARDDIRAATRNPNVEAVAADLGSLKQVRELARTLVAQFSSLGVMIHNAGVFMQKKEMTADGFETTFAVNHLAPFLLTALVLDTLKQNAPARIVVVSSNTHQSVRAPDVSDLPNPQAYDGYTAYRNSKLCNVMFTYALARRLENTAVTVNALHPGVIATKLLHHGWGGSGGDDLKRGAETPVFLAVAPEVANVTGKYFVNRRMTDSSALSQDEGLQEELWRRSEEWTEKRTED